MLHKDIVGADLHIARALTGAGSPVGSVTPGIIGQFYFDTTNKTIYTATGLTSADWVHSWSDGSTALRDACAAYATGVVTLTTSGVWYKLLFAGESFDFLGSWDTALSKFTATKAGVFMVQLKQGYNNLPLDSRVLTSMYLNGALSAYMGEGISPTTNFISVDGLHIVQLAEGDVVEFYSNSDSSGLVTDANAQLSYISIVKIA